MGRIQNSPIRVGTGKVAGLGEVWHLHTLVPVVGAGFAPASAGSDFSQMLTSDTVQAVSTSALDVTQSVYVVGIDSNGKLASEMISLTGTTAVDSVNTFLYIENIWLSGLCTGEVSLREKTSSHTVQVLPIGSIEANVIQHFTGEAYSYLSQWWAELHFDYVEGVDDITAQLRWYPSAADCLVGDGSYLVLDRFSLTVDDTATKVLLKTTANRVFKPALTVPPSGWLTIHVSSVNEQAGVIVGVRGTDIIQTAS